MFRLQLLGGASLTGPLGPVTGRGGHRHRLALLALLSRAGEKGCGRDKLVAYLWPESDTSHARHRLSDSVYLLRQELGEDSIEVLGEDMRLNREVVTVDVVAFEDALERDDLEAAAALYGGPFLDGFHLDASREFEEWREAEGIRLADLHAKTLESLARQADRVGDPARAADWWKRLLSEDPLSSRVVLSLMEALAAAGDPANAVQLARAHERLLHEELGMELPSEIRSLVQRLRDEQTSGGSASNDRTGIVDSKAWSMPVSKALEDPRVPDDRQPIVSGVGGAREGHRRLVVPLLLVVLVASVTSVWVWSRTTGKKTDQAAVEFYLDPPDPTMSFGARLVFSPDGRRLVAEMETDEGSMLYQRMLAGRGWQVIPGTREAYAPFFSPDGKWLGFASSQDRTINRVPVDGGPVQVIVRVGKSIEGATWGPDNSVVFSTVESASGDKWPSLMRVSVDGGTAERLTTLDPSLGDVAHRDPHSLASGKVVLFTAVNGLLELEVAALSLESGRVSRLAPGMTPLGGPADRVLYVTPDGSVVVQTFNQRTLALEGTPRSVAEGIAIAGGIVASYTVSADGSLAYFSESHQGDELLVVSRRGETRPLFRAGVGSRITGPRYSPSGDRIAFVLDGSVWVYSCAQGTAQRLSFEGPAADPAWTTDGRFVAYSIVEGGRSLASLYRRAADGTGSAERLLTDDRDHYQVDFAPGDSEIVFFSTNNIFRASLGDSSEATSLLEAKAFVEHPTLSHDGRWLAYKSNESGCDEVYVRSYPDMGPPTLVSAGGCGRSPAWSDDGSEVFYWSPDRLVAASVRHDGSRIMVVRRDELFSAKAFRQHWNRDYDVRPDGREFVMVSRPKRRTVVKVGALADER